MPVVKKKFWITKKKINAYLSSPYEDIVSTPQRVLRMTRKKEAEEEGIVHIHARVHSYTTTLSNPTGL